MKKDNPPFTITTKILNLCTNITQLLGQYEGIKSPSIKPMLRRNNKVKSIQSSLAIEGNSLTLDQVSDIIEGKRVVGPPNDILEVQNAIEVYKRIKEFKPYNIKSFLLAHKILMKGLTPDAGRIRNSGVGILKAGKISHIAPKHTMVPKLIDNLFSFLKTEKDIILLIRSSVLHYEIEFIHPFSDGNGRMGRLWQYVLLVNYHPLFEVIPIESIIRNKQKQYYRSLEQSDKQGESTLFIEFMLEAILEAIAEFMKEFSPELQTKESRLTEAKNHFKETFFSRKHYIQFHKTISTSTASRDLSLGVKNKIIKKFGEKSRTMYQFI